MNLEELNCLDLEVGRDWAMLAAYFRGCMEVEGESEFYKKYAAMKQ